MYLRDLRIQNLKLLKDFHLSFTDAEGKPRLWTVIIGENGTGKSSILQAIALAAAGALKINSLADSRWISGLRDRRSDAPIDILADFGFSASRHPERRYPRDPETPPEPIAPRLRSRVWMEPERSTLRTESSYYGEGWDPPDPSPPFDPLDQARDRDEPLWFVAGYGVTRTLPDAGHVPPLAPGVSVDRLRALFPPTAAGQGLLAATAFANALPEPKRTWFVDALNEVIKNTALFPNISGIELKDRQFSSGGIIRIQMAPVRVKIQAGKPPVVTGGTRIIGAEEGHQIVQALPSGPLSLPSIWFSHGYQSTTAWIADLIGHQVQEADRYVPPSEMEGIVLIDEIDLYLHPLWQVNLIRGLKASFPRMQFIVTTHSPLVLTGLRPDRDGIVRLDLHPRTGNVQIRDLRGDRAAPPDPRLMTGTEIYRTYFGIERLYPDHIGDWLREYRYLAADPWRTDEDERRLDDLFLKLASEGVAPDFPREPRATEPEGP